MGDLKEEKIAASEHTVTEDKSNQKLEKTEKPEQTHEGKTITPKDSYEGKKTITPKESYAEKKTITPKESYEEKLERVHERTDTTTCKAQPIKETKSEKCSNQKPPAEGEKIEDLKAENEKIESEKVECEKTIEKELLLPIDSKSKAAAENVETPPIKKVSDSVPYCPKPREKIIRNQSDIFSLKDISTTLQTSIFSVNGSPSRKVFRKQEPAGHVFPKSGEDGSSDKTDIPKPSRITRENYNDEKRPSSSYRNPLTGTGLSSNDEYKSKGIKRKDGNPLLGLGYDSEVASAASQHRVPPGGFSHKLW